jgi:predicted Zn-dependent protease
MPYHSPISDRNPEPNNRDLLSLFLFFISLVLIVVIAVFTLINQVINFIPIELEQKIGSLVTSQLNIGDENSLTQIQLNKLLDNLEQEIPNNSPGKRDYQLLYVPEPTVNALAVPGDKIIIYQGLLEKMDSENELVMILGHEIGHFAHRDHLKKIGNILLMKLLLSFFWGQGDIVSSGANLTNLIVNSQYSQQQETEADKFGLDLLHQYYGHVAGAADFFEKLQQENQPSNPIAFLSTHPLPEKRVTRLKQLIQENNYSIGQKVDLPVNVN